MTRFASDHLERCHEESVSFKILSGNVSNVEWVMAEAAIREAKHILSVVEPRGSYVACVRPGSWAPHQASMDLRALCDALWCFVNA